MTVELAAKIAESWLKVYRHCEYMIQSEKGSKKHFLEVAAEMKQAGDSETSDQYLKYADGCDLAIVAIEIIRKKIEAIATDYYD